MSERIPEPVPVKRRRVRSNSGALKEARAAFRDTRENVRYVRRLRSFGTGDDEIARAMGMTLEAVKMIQ